LVHGKEMTSFHLFSWFAATEKRRHVTANSIEIYTERETRHMPLVAATDFLDDVDIARSRCRVSGFGVAVFRREANVHRVMQTRYSMLEFEKRVAMPSRTLPSSSNPAV
jgi:hypothetical protein